MILRGSFTVMTDHHHNCVMANGPEVGDFCHFAYFMAVREHSMYEHSSEITAKYRAFESLSKLKVLVVELLILYYEM